MATCETILSQLGANAHLRSDAPIRNPSYWQVYVKNHEHTWNEILSPLVSRGEIAKNYENALRQIHTGLVVGDGKGPRYHGFFDQNDNGFNNWVFPGKFAFEVAIQKNSDLNKSSQFIRINTIRIRDREGFIPDLPSTPIAVRFIPKESLPKTRAHPFVSFLYIHEFPSYLQQKEVWLPAIIKAFEAVWTSRDGSQDAFLDNLSDFFHLGVNSHIFPKVNFSTFLIQVNYFLRMRGLKEIQAGYIDLIAFTMSSTEFRKFFKKRIFSQNSKN